MFSTVGGGSTGGAWVLGVGRDLTNHSPRCLRIALKTSRSSDPGEKKEGPGGAFPGQPVLLIKADLSPFSKERRSSASLWDLAAVCPDFFQNGSWSSRLLGEHGWVESRKKEFDDEDGDDNSSDIGDEAHGDQVPRFPNPHRSQVHGQHIECRLGTPHDHRGNSAGERVWAGHFDDLRKDAEGGAAG